MKNCLKIVLSIMIVISTFTIKAQTFSVSTDSVFTVRQYNSITPEDTTGIINLQNMTPNPIQIKIRVIFEDLSPNGIALIEYASHAIFSTDSLVVDSLIIQGNDSVNFDAIFFPPTPNLPDNRVRLLVYDQNDSLNSHQILTFAAINCNALNNQIIIDPLIQYCQGDSAFISASTSFSGYVWSNGDTSQTVHISVNSVITIVAKDSIGCINRDTLNLNVSLPFDEEICIVSVDSATQKNIIVWEKTASVRTVQTFIYKESFQAGVYNLIGLVPFDSLSVFIDNSSIPLQSAASYKISTVDSCGNESARSVKHKTIHLTANVGVGGENNLVWDGYEGFPFTTYNVLRGSSSSNMSVLASVANTLFTFTDLTPLSGSNIYQIEAVRSNGCSPTQKTYLSSVSNGVTIISTGTNNLEQEQNLTIYPNPTTGKLTIGLGIIYNTIKVNVKDITGRTVLVNTFNTTDEINIDINDKEAGLYFVEITTDKNNVVTKKILKD